MTPSAQIGAAPLLDVRDLRVAFRTPDGVLEAVSGLSFSVARGQVLGIVGESGSGKSVATQTMVGLTRGARITGEALFEGQNLLAMSPDQLRAVRGRGIAMVFQNPLSSLHPLYRIGWQIVEMIQAHESVTKAQARARAIELLGLVGIPHPARRVDDYPHQFSGGMLQRAMIAMALALNPRLLVADEVIVMYAGRAMEVAPRRALFREPSHPYTRGLLHAIPRADLAGGPLTPIPGQPPSLIARPPGCPFHPRCTEAVDRCGHDTPPLDALPGAVHHLSSCWRTVGNA